MQGAAETPSPVGQQPAKRLPVVGVQKACCTAASAQREVQRDAGLLRPG